MVASLRYTEEMCVFQATYESLQDAKTDADSDLAQVINAVETKFFPNKSAP